MTPNKLNAAVLLGVLLIVTTLVQESTSADTESMRNTDQASCISIESVPLCSGLGYNGTTFPNMRGHTTPEEANDELTHFLQLISTGCSNAIVHLLCSIYAPLCLEKYLGYSYPPCKSLCEYVRDGCVLALEEFGYHWPPNHHLECENYETKQKNTLCFGPDDPSTLILPSIKMSPGALRNFTATPLSSSTVRFSWDYSDSENESFILTCEPEPYLFPLSITKTTIKAGNFIANTKYTCRVFKAHTINLRNSTVIYFKTPKEGPPHNLAVTHRSSNSVILSWNHPDSELPEVQLDKFLYSVSCVNNKNNQNIQVPKIVKGESYTVEDLQPNTNYTCQVSLTLSEKNTLVTFTTLENLKIRFINDTPSIEANTVRLEFLTNRPVSKISCRILGQSAKIDCSDHRATFQDIPKGDYTLRIAAENNKKDRLVLKIKIHVSGSNNQFCAVNLINERIMQVDNSVMIYFKGTNSVDEFECRLDDQNSFPCYPPLFLRSLNVGTHQIRIKPIAPQCIKRAVLNTVFTVE